LSEAVLSPVIGDDHADAEVLAKLADTSVHGTLLFAVDRTPIASGNCRLHADIEGKTSSALFRTAQKKGRRR
jgi:hypothetical protein